MKKFKLIPLIVLVACLLCSAFVIYQLEFQKLAAKRERTRYVTASEVSKLQYTLDSLFLKTQILEMLVVEGNGVVKNFDSICEKLLDHSSIRSLQLAPNGVVTYVYPLEGNEQAFGDLFSDPDRKTEAEYARDSGNMTLAGPYELSQGGLGAVARRPIYIPDQNGISVFWGFAVIVLDIPDAFYPAELDAFTKEGFDYQLHRINPTTKEIQIIDASTQNTLKNPMSLSFQVPNGIWTFSVAPTEGWLHIAPLCIELVIAVLISTLFFFLTAVLVRLKHQSETMRSLSTMDNLTGLKNQRLLTQTLTRLSAEHRPFSLFYLDFDGFKEINDTYGHAYGDLFLIESARRLSKAFGQETSVFRIGGDEFAMIAERALSTSDCGKLLDQVNRVFSDPFCLESNTVTASVSIGYARCPEDAAGMEPLIRIADQAMYKMKLSRKKQKGDAYVKLRSNPSLSG